jgi:ribosomal protein S18 acetylase RimI-like enzyme
MIVIKENVLTASEFNMLCRSVGWIPPSDEQTAKALENSLRTFSVFSDAKLVGMGRLLGDLAMSYYVKDVAILPDYQGQGIGKTLMVHMINHIKTTLPQGWRVSLELISSKGKEGFYRKFGFEDRPSDADGAGMFMMIEPPYEKHLVDIEK